jgi:hypothetical protein
MFTRRTYGRIMGRVAIAGGRDDQILRHHHHDRERAAPLHDRMPAVIPPDGWDDWLGENSTNEGVVKTLLRPYPGQAMAFWAVDRRVGNVRNDSPDLFAPFNGAQNRSCGQ